MATRIPYDFATAGDMEEVPSVSATDELSFQSGWSEAYEKDSDEAGYRYLSRDEHNYLWNVITSNIREWQQQTFPDWISDELDSGIPYAYDTGAIVRYTDGLNYISLVDSNTGEPSVSSDWKVFGSSNLMDLTTDQSSDGVKTFTSSPIVPTPATDYQAATKEYVDGLAIGVGQTWQNVTASRSAGVTYTNTTGRPIMIVTTMDDVSDFYSIYVDGVQVTEQNIASSGSTISTSIIVTQGSTYYLEISGTSTLREWVELR